MSQLPGIPERPRPAPPDASVGSPAPDGRATALGQTFDPLRLCVYTTIALITWAAGPFAVLGFAILGLLGYWRAHQAGLTRTKCYLRDVRLVLLYLGLAALASSLMIVVRVLGWFD